MAQKKLQATAKLFLDTSSAQQDAAQFVKDIKQKLQSIETAADKVGVFKDLVGYIGQVDRALSMLKAKNADVFANMFDGLDANLREQLEGLFGISGSQLGQIDALRDKLATLTPKSGIKELRNFAKEINGLFASIGMNEPFDIDKQFSGRASKAHIELLTNELTNFATVWKDVNAQVSKGFGGSGGGNLNAAKLEQEIKGLKSRLAEYRKVQEELRNISTARESFLQDEWLDESISIEYTTDSIKQLAKEFQNAKIAKENFENSGDTSSLEYYQTLAKYSKAVLQANDIWTNAIDGNKNFAKELKDTQFGSSNLYNFINDIIDPDIDAVFDNLTGNIGNIINQLESKITQTVGKLQSINNNTGEAAFNNIGNAANETGEKVDMLGKKLLNVSEYVSALSGQLKEMFSAAGRSANFEYHIAIDGLDVKARHGSEKSVDLATQTETYLDTLFSDSVLYGHSHRGGTAATNIYDIENVLSSYRDGVAIPVHFVVGKDAITTMDFTGLSQDMVNQLMHEIATTNSNKNAPVINDNINKIVEKFTGKSGALKTWSVDQFDDLAKYLYDVSSAASSALTPIEKFQAVLDNMFGRGKVDASKYESLLSGLDKDNAKNIFNQIASMENLKPIKATDMLTMGQVNAEIDASIAKYKTLREEANLSYSDIRNEVDKVIEHYNSGGSATSGLDFFQKYFPEGEWQNVRNLLTDAYDNLISIEEVTNRIANEFGVDPDTFAQIPNGTQAVQINDAKSKLEEFLALSKEIRDKNFFNTGSAEDNVEVGKYAEKLEAAKNELVELGIQGQITAEQLESVNAAFDSAKMHLDNVTQHYDGYGSGYGDYTYDDIKSERQRADEAESIAERLSKENNDLQNEINDLRNQIDDDSGIHGDADDIQRENGALEQKLELLKEIADAYGTHITQAARNRYEALSDKEMESGLTSREEDRMSELSDTISEADSNLAEFEETYDRIILKLSNGKKVEILPDDAGLRKLYKISNEYYDGEYNGFEIDDVEFVRQEQFIRTQIESYEELCGVVQRFNELRYKERSGKENIEFQAILDRFKATKGDVPLDKMTEDTIKWTRMMKTIGDIDVDSFADYLGMQIPNAAQKAETAVTDVVESTKLFYAGYGQYALFDDIMVGADKAKTKVEELNGEIEKVGIVDGQIGFDDYLSSIKEVGSEKHVEDSIGISTSGELAQLEALQAKLLEVKAAVDTKTTAFEEEYVTVDGAVEAEIASLQSLISKLLEVAAQIDSISNGLLKINNTPVSLDLTTEGSQLEATQNIDAEVSQLAQLQQTLASVTSAVVAKTKAFSDEGVVVGQAVGKEVAGLMKLSDVVDSVSGKVNALVTNLKELKKSGVDVKKSDTTKDDKKKSDDTKESDKKKGDTKPKVKHISQNDSIKETDINYIRNKKLELMGSYNKLNLGQQKEVRKQLDQAIIQLDQYINSVQDGNRIELDSIHAVTAALHQKMEAYHKVNEEVQKAKKQQTKDNGKYGSTTAINATAKFNRLSEWAGKDQFDNSEVVTKSLEEYTNAYQKMINKQKELSQVQGTIPESQKAEFKRLTDEYNAQAKALEKILAASEKLSSSSIDKFKLGDDFVDDSKGRESALKSFVQTMDGVDESTIKFTDDFNKCMFSVNNGDGTFTKITARFTDARNEIVALGGETKKATTFLGGFFDELKGKFKSIGAYLIASVSFYEVWNVIKQGVGYVTEIDSALTELKKVTNETDASYGQFLQNMSKTGSTIGATVANLTTMASEWARLGYSMEEAGRLAESTAILLNVSEFDDATAASEALISTMQAFQYTADESGHVVDILNEVKVTCLLIQ